MDLVVVGVVAGVLGTLVMDLLNLLFARVGIITQMHMEVLGRMAVGWARGRFRYGHPSEMKKVAYELVYGYVAHYAIGVSLAVSYVLGWDLLVGGPASPVLALAYGVATTAATWFFVFPSLGFGAFGRRSPQGLRATLSSLANHAFYGLGIAIGIALM
jgi:hypothetical protein